MGQDKKAGSLYGKAAHRPPVHEPSFAAKTECMYGVGTYLCTSLCTLLVLARRIDDRTCQLAFAFCHRTSPPSRLTTTHSANWLSTHRTTSFSAPFHCRQLSILLADHLWNGERERSLNDHLGCASDCFVPVGAPCYPKNPVQGLDTTTLHRLNRLVDQLVSLSVFFVAEIGYLLGKHRNFASLKMGSYSRVSSQALHTVRHLFAPWLASRIAHGIRP